MIKTLFFFFKKFEVQSFSHKLHKRMPLILTLPLSHTQSQCAFIEKKQIKPSHKISENSLKKQRCLHTYKNTNSRYFLEKKQTNPSHKISKKSLKSKFIKTKSWGAFLEKKQINPTHKISKNYLKNQTHLHTNKSTIKATVCLSSRASNQSLSQIFIKSRVTVKSIIYIEYNLKITQIIPQTCLRSRKHLVLLYNQACSSLMTFIMEATLWIFWNDYLRKSHIIRIDKSW